MVDRLPPQNIEAEEAVLGSCLIDNDALLIVKHVLTAKDFYREKNAWVYQAMLDLEAKREPIDLLTLSHALGEKLGAVGGPAHLTKLSETVPTSVHAEYYAKLVVSCANHRRLDAAARKIAAIAYNGEDDLESFSKALDALREAEPTGRPVESVGGPALDKEMLWALAMAQKDKSDREQGGWQAEWPWGVMRQFAATWRIAQPVGIIAEGGAGKTMVAMEIARHAATNGGHVVYLHTEDEPRILLMRQAASISGVPFRQIETATYAYNTNQMESSNVMGVEIHVPRHLLYAIHSVQKGWRGDLWFVQVTNLTMPEILYKLARHEAEYGTIDCVVFDWFLDHRLRGNQNNAVIEITRDLQELKGWIGDHHTRLLIVSQTGKMGAGKGRLTAYDAFFTSAIAHYCKLVLTIKREREKIDGEAIGPFKPEMEIFIAKANLDMTGAFKLFVKGDSFMVTDETLKLGTAYGDD